MNVNCSLQKSQNHRISKLQMANAKCIMKQNTPVDKGEVEECENYLYLNFNCCKIHNARE